MIFFDANVIGPWVCARAGGTWTPGRGAAIGLIKGGQIRAGVLYEDYNKAHVICHIAGEGRWACKEFLWVIFDYPFTQLNVRRITVPVASSNTTARNFVEKLGFELEAILQGAHPDGDILVYKMTADQCRWLGLSDATECKRLRAA